ncbi:MAG TPA: succinyl-diaminopimelate desuccinylase [Caulobacteraceae bacterium]|jgi:succinyl-diaminopimelate desuccinylase
MPALTEAAIDPIALARDLIRRPSVTPADAGAMEIVEGALMELGFTCRRMKFGEIENLYARRGTARPNLCFAGHTDVVPAGDEAAWAHGPFAAALDDRFLHGRGAVDMKSAIAAFIAAVAALEMPPAGSLSLLITGDEEGDAEHGTRAVVAALADEGEVIDHCLVGEPTSSAVMGDMIKIGRRGSLNATITVEGVQGHVAYPDRAANPAPVLIRYLAAVQARELDTGYPGFQPSNLEITSIDIGNPAANVIPARAAARLNIRFNPGHLGADLAAWLEDEGRTAGEGFAGKVAVSVRISGEAFLTEPGKFTQVVAGAVEAVSGVAPELSTSGGTSDARFIRALCPVVEFGLVGTTMHKVDERAPVREIATLTAVYRRLIDDYFAAFAG